MSCKLNVWWQRGFSGDFDSLKAIPEADNRGGRTS